MVSTSREVRVPVSSTGPDLVLAGAARSGTSSLAAQLGAHPDIDAGKIKESNYFSREFDRGPDWYESLYAERRGGLMRLDASTSYTSPQFPKALSRLAEAAPDVLVIYAVRQPTERALSHYLLRRHYFQNEHASDFGAALDESALYPDTSDYSRWIPALRETFSDERLLVVPFEVITGNAAAVTAEICGHLGLAPPPDTQAHGSLHRNHVVQYRNDLARTAARTLRQSPAYPWLRNLLGAGRTRKFRGLLTRQAQLPSTDEAMASCDATQLEMLRALDRRAGATVREYLRTQDQRLGLSWASASFASQH